jgi:hypothetical protein
MTNTQTSLIEAAMNYVPPMKTKNISELQQVPVNIDVITEQKEGKDGPYVESTITVDGQKYRIPQSVLGQLKTYLKELPTMKYFKVIKVGSTKDDTKYTVIPLQQSQVK